MIATQPAEDWEGRPRRNCDQHRTTGHRAWCYTCTEWCYPTRPCQGCAEPSGNVRTVSMGEQDLRRRECELRGLHYMKSIFGKFFSRIDFCTHCGDVLFVVPPDNPTLGFTRWVVSLEDSDNRRRVTLPQIIERARAALREMGEE